MPAGVDRARIALVALAVSAAISGGARAEAVTFNEHLVSSEAPQADGVAVGDVDGDGDMDVVSGEYAISAIAWYENDGADPPGWTKHIVGSADGAIHVAVGDVDRDGDGDVFSANFNDEGIAWYENLGGTPRAWAKRLISAFWVGAWGVDAADVDGDGDLDAVGGLTNTACGPPLPCVGVEWYDNDGGAPPSFTPRPISPGIVGALSVHATDIDGDGDIDVLAVDNGNDRVLLYVNDGASPPGWTQHVISITAVDPWSVVAADLDRDGDGDPIVASVGDDRVTWYENDGSTPPGWTAHPLPTTTNGPISVSAADLDGDGDVDVTAGSDGTTLAWYESDGGAPPAFVEHLIGVCVSPLAIDTASVDGDADTDVVCAANFFPGKVHLFSNGADFLETDGDGVRDDLDCAPGDALAFAVPGEVRRVRFPTKTSIAWAHAGLIAGAGTVHDVVRGSLAQLPVGTGGDELCLIQGTPDASLAVEPVPPSGTGFYYIVRGTNACGTGSYGYRSPGIERVSSACRPR